MGMKQYRDHYFLKAKQEHYPARSVYKLLDLDKKFKFLRLGLAVLELGAAPGSWILATASKIGANGQILACDLQNLNIDLPENTQFFISNVLEPTPEFQKALDQIGTFDLVLSDMAPATCGNKFTDQCRSLELANTAFELACQKLKPNGNFIVKIFMGPDSQDLLNSMRRVFHKAQSAKPPSSRTESKEIFFVGLQYKG